MTKHIYVIVNANLIVQYVIQIKYGIMKHVNVNMQIVVSAKKIIVGILAHALLRIEGTLKKLLYFSDWVWWNCNCYGYCINKKDKYYSSKKDKCYKNCLSKLS